MLIRSWKFCVMAILVLAALSACASAQKREEPNDPFYARYPVKVVFQGISAIPKLTSPEARAYRTRLRYAAKSGPDFADHYDMAVWGCGAGCLEFAVIDAKTGNVTFFPFTVSQSREKGDKLNFRRDSRAIHVIGSLNEQDDSADRWYLWTGKEFSLISEKPAELFDDSSNSQ
jgi:hypothetical protein